MPACSVCGFVPSTVTPPDAIVTIRSLPRRYRSALGAIPDDAAREALLMTAPPGEPHSAVGLVDEVAAALANHATAIGASAEVAASTSSSAALSRLESTVSTLAAALDTVKGDAWLDDRGGDTAQDRARDAAHIGVHNLRRIPPVIDAARS